MQPALSKLWMQMIAWKPRDDAQATGWGLVRGRSLQARDALLKQVRSRSNQVR